MPFPPPSHHSPSPTPLFSISSFTKLYPTLRAVGFLEKPTARRVSISLESLFSFTSSTLFLYVTCIPNSQRNPNVHHSKVTKVSYQSIHRSTIDFIDYNRFLNRVAFEVKYKKLTMFLDVSSPVDSRTFFLGRLLFLAFLTPEVFLFLA